MIPPKLPVLLLSFSVLTHWVATSEHPIAIKYLLLLLLFWIRFDDMPCFTETTAQPSGPCSTQA